MELGAIMLVGVAQRSDRWLGDCEYISVAYERATRLIVHVSDGYLALTLDKSVPSDEVSKVAESVRILSKDIVLNEVVGQLKILGRRHVAVDMQALCEHLDLLVGPQVAEVVINSHESRLGRQDGEEVQRENPNATKMELIRKLEHSWRFSGIGAVDTRLLPTEEAP